MQIKQFEYVLKVAEEGSITRAAEKLYVSQQNISESLKLLETELGFRIFQRSNKGVVLTDLGKVFLKDLEQIMTTIDSWKFLAQKELETKTIEILLQYGLRDLLNDNNLYDVFSNADVNIKWKALNGYQMIEALKKEENVIGIMLLEQDSLAHKQLVKLNEKKNCTMQCFNAGERVAVLQAEDPLSQKEAVSLTDLCNYHLVCHNVAEKLSFMDQIRRCTNKQIFYLPEIADIFSFIVQHPQSFSYVPSITLKNNSYINEGKLACRSVQKCDFGGGLSMFAIMINKNRDELYSRIYNSLTRFLKEYSKKLDID